MTIMLRDGLPGNLYLTSRGLKIRLLRQRQEGGRSVDEFVVASLASGGHEVVLPGSTPVHLDREVGMVVPNDLAETGDWQLRGLARRIIQETTATVDRIAEITNLSGVEITNILQKIMRSGDGI